MIEIDVTVFMQIIDAALRAAFLTVFFALGLVIGGAIAKMIIGDDEEGDDK